MRKKRGLAAALGVLLLVCILYGAFMLTGKEPQEEPGGDETIAVNTGKNAVSVRITPGEGKPYTILVKGEAEGGRSLWLDGYDSSAAIDIDAAGRLVSSLETLKAYGIVTGDPKEYGIEKNCPEAEVSFADGSRMKLTFGAETPVPGRAYVMDEDKGKIYIVRKDIAELCGQSVYGLRKAQLLADYFGTVQPFAATEIQLVNDEGSCILIRPQTAGEAAVGGSDAPSYYWMAKPVERECSDGKVDEAVLSQALALDQAARVFEDFPKDLSGYGFQDGCPRLRVEAKDKACEILFGKDAGDGQIYAMRTDIPSVLKVEKSALSILKLQWYDLINTSLWMRSIDKVESVDLVTPKNSWRLSLERDEKGALQGGDLNGIAIDEKDVRDLYMKVLAIHIEGRLLDGEGKKKVNQQADYLVSIHCLNGDTESYDFYGVDARRYAIVGKGGAADGFYTGTTELSNLEKALSAIKQ